MLDSLSLRAAHYHSECEEENNGLDIWGRDNISVLQFGGWPDFFFFPLHLPTGEVGVSNYTKKEKESISLVFLFFMLVFLSLGA